ncbi:MAG TPA: cysteine--tRNA ligase [Patescibacteria group bacterium]|nr:cysteine--tRNA ligase [Patescibacteria group bacterium]
MQIQLYNTLHRTIEPLKPIKYKEIKLYTCGPTVYHFAHIGNLRTYIFEDILRRTLEYFDYSVNHAMNITDVGHLVGDGDEGEDKMEVGARREGVHPLEIAKKYETKFFEDMTALSNLQPHKVLRATDSIAEQIEIIKILEEKGFTYQDEAAIYFDTSKLKDYGKLSGQKLEDKLVGSRGDVVVDSSKKHPADFALWFFLTGRYKNHILQWPSPWGVGFPGWHIECSAISRKLLGQPFDIHCGGVDHIGTHHTNEIAQSEAAFDTPLCNFWMHGEFLNVDSKRMGKSEGNLFTLDQLKEKGIHPLAFRYFCLNAHYRTQLNFTLEAVAGAASALERLYRQLEDEHTEEYTKNQYTEKFDAALATDLNTPQAIAAVWELLSDTTIPGRKAQVRHMLKILGFPDELPVLDTNIPIEISEKLKTRQMAKENKDFALADTLRSEVQALGFEILDTKDGQKLKKLYE